jgi:hypothetical protein
MATESVQCGDKAGVFGDDDVTFVCEDGSFVSPSTWVAPPAYAFEPSNFSCQTDPVVPPFQVNASTFYSSRLISSEGASSDYGVDVFSALSLAAVKWNALPDSGKCVQLRVSPTATGEDSEQNGASVVVFESGFSTDRPTGLMYTDLYYDVLNPEAGAVSCDIQVWGEALVKAHTSGGVKVTGGLKYLVWDTDDDPANNPTTTAVDTHTVMMPTAFAHELGHCLGLGHPGLADSIMSKRVRSYGRVDPSPIDEQATAFLYCSSWSGGATPRSTGVGCRRPWPFRPGTSIGRRPCWPARRPTAFARRSSWTSHRLRSSHPGRSSPARRA